MMFQFGEKSKANKEMRSSESFRLLLTQPFRVLNTPKPNGKRADEVELLKADRSFDSTVKL